MILTLSHSLDLEHIFWYGSRVLLVGIGGHRTQEKASDCMRINLASVFVDNQEKARKFYTEVLGFREKHAVPVGEFLWLTVVSPEDPDGTELLLEPNDNPAAKTFQEAIFRQHIAATSFAVVDIQHEYERLKGHGVVFEMAPTEMGPVTIAVFDDTCGNLIQLTQA
jgi:catechol 2,3-dioxygenase-like lactoylglutathione lyase family enzyme